MKLWDRRTIAGKLTRLNLQVTGTALLAAYVAFLAYDLYTLRKDLISSLTTEAGIVGENSVTALMFDDQQAAESTLSALENSPQIRWAVIERADGSVFARYAHGDPEEPDLKASLKPGESLNYWTKGTNILMGRRIVFQGRALGSVYLLAETGELSHRARQFGLLSALILALCFVIAVLATSTIRHLVAGPLTELAGTAQVVSKEQDYSIRAPMPNGSDELAFLVRSFNEMLEQIQERDRALEESRNALEQRVRERTMELTEANKELEAFSYSVAHDLRGPLQHITNIAFMLQNSSDDGYSAEDRALIEKLTDGADGMAKLIDDLLNLSSATSTPLRRTAIDLSQMAETILDRLTADDGARQARYTVAKGARAIADEGLMKIVLENLLRNAWKYTSKVEAAEIEFGFAEEAAGTVYFVRDNGAGFNPRYSDRLFRPFQRLHSQSEFAGTGIGLATALRIVARHGGRIWADGYEGRGAAFYFTLPYGAEG
jgi:signal transduction histidine kinase